MKITIEKMLYEIRNIPDIVTEMIGVRFSFKNLNPAHALFNIQREMYRAKADWLSYYLEGNSSLHLELTLTYKADYKIDAEFSLAKYRILQEAFLLSPSLQNLYKSPENCLLIWEKDAYLHNLKKNSGLLGKADRRSGKSEHYKNIIELAKTVENARQLPKLEVTRPEEQFTSGAHLMMNEICLIASHPENVKFRGHYKRFIDAVKRHARELRNSDMGLVAIRDNKLHVITAGNRGKAKS